MFDRRCAAGGAGAARWRNYNAGLLEKARRPEAFENDFTALDSWGGGCDETCEDHLEELVFNVRDKICGEYVDAEFEISYVYMDEAEGRFNVTGGFGEWDDDNISAGDVTLHRVKPKPDKPKTSKALKREDSANSSSHGRKKSRK